MNRTHRAGLLVALMALSGAASADGVAAWLMQINSLQSTFRAVTAQAAVSATKRAATRVQASAGLSSAMIEAFTRRQVLSVWKDYGPKAQVIAPCMQMSMANTVTGVKGQVDGSALSVASAVYATSDSGMVQAGGITGLLGAQNGKYRFPYAATVAVRQARHRQKYCTVAESAAGICQLSPNGMQGADADFSVHVVPGKTFGWDQSEAAADFVKAVAPVRAASITGRCTSPECVAAYKSRTNEEAYLSMARYSFLRFVESRQTQLAGDAKVAVAQ